MQSASLLRRWNDGVADLLIHRDRPDIVDRFLAHLSRCVDFDQWYAVLFHRHAPAERIGFEGIRQGRDDYEDGLYLLDPFYQEYRRRSEPSVHRLEDLARAGSRRTPYFERYLKKWDTRDEVGYLVPIPGGRCVHLSVSRSHDLPAFERHEVQFLASLVSVVASVFALHHCADPGPVEEQPAIDHLIGQKLGAFGAGVLTGREGEIAFLLLKGYGAAEIADLLGITHGTAKNHMKSVYRKLGVRSQVDLLVQFIDDLYD